ncbi:MAG TPA: PepSY domain-containing protein [Pseudolabrys sp.]|nr:PepSY domain-containing protein [Pseudolabrys sp.]
MNGAFRVVRGAAFCAVLAALPLAALAYAGEELASGAQVNVAQARAIALRAVPGEIADEELETEEGGSGLRYTFEIKHGPDVYEVGVDAKTGALLENIVEGKSPQ